MSDYMSDCVVVVGFVLLSNIMYDEIRKHNTHYYTLQHQHAFSLRKIDCGLVQLDMWAVLMGWHLVQAKLLRANRLTSLSRTIFFLTRWWTDPLGFTHFVTPTCKY